MRSRCSQTLLNRRVALNAQKQTQATHKQAASRQREKS